MSCKLQNVKNQINCQNFVKCYKFLLMEEIYDQFLELIKSNPSLKSVLSHPYCYIIYQAGDDILNRIIRKNIKKVFHYAIKLGDKPYVLTSYKILTVINNAFVQDVIDNNLLLDNYSSVFEAEQINTLVINRYSMVLTVTLSASVKNSDQTCSLLVKLLDNVNYLAVYYLYNSIYTFTDRFVRNRNAIQNLHLEVLISQYIRRIDINQINFNDPLDPTTTRLVAWYNLIKVAIDNNVYDKQFVSDDVWQSLSIDAEVPDCVFDARWDAIASFCKKTQPSFCMVFFYQAISLFPSPIEKLYPRHVSALDVITNILPAAKTSLPTDVIQSIVSSLFIHPANTFFHLAVIHLAEILAIIPDLCNQAAILFVLPLVKEAREREHSILYVSAFKLVDIFVNSAKNNKGLNLMLTSINDVVSFIQNELAEHNRLLDSPYGEAK